MAPNLITLCGLGFILFNLVLVVIFVPDMATPTHPFVYFSFAAGVWLYSTFDNVDGKQARRTNSSSPLGELFDHGCDALNCGFGAIIQIAGLGLGQSWLSVFVPFLAIVAFYFSTWEEYYTGILYLGYINGPTEGLIIACATMILSGIYGPAIWSQPLMFYTPKYFHSIVPNMPVVEFITVGMTFLLVFLHVPTSVLSVYKACKRKNISFASALFNLNPLLIYVVFSYLWLNAKSSVILHNHLLLFILTIGIVFGRIATKVYQSLIPGDFSVCY
jgi:ethanolaminephosphotransferase